MDEAGYRVSVDSRVRTVPCCHRLEQNIGFSTTNFTHNDVFWSLTQCCFQQLELTDFTFARLTTETLSRQTGNPVGLWDVYFTSRFDTDNLHLPRNKQAHRVQCRGLSRCSTTDEQHRDFILERNPEVSNHQAGHGAESNDIARTERIFTESSDTECGTACRYFSTQLHDDSRTIHQCCIQQGLGNRNVFATTLSEFDYIRFQFHIVGPCDGGFHRLKLSMISENWNVGAVQTDVFYVGIVHQNIHSSVAN